MAKVSLRAYNQEIETMIDRGHLDEAIAHCRHILKTFPRHLETYRLLGKAYLEYKRYPEAADIFSRVLVAIPSDFVANVGMSIIRDEENRLDEAIWHMERAFETQPSNAAIQSELQRLYGRREGVQPPRIRMTRGALAHMYVQGELYPQAISEIKGVLKEDPNRHDMQVLLARAYYRSGLKNDAAEAASVVLRNNPYNLDANRVMVEILSADRPESVQAYRQRVVELDPYAAQVTTSVFLSNEVPDAAVAVEHLDWNGQPVGLQPDWQTARAISLESPPPQDEQPDWLKDAFGGQPSVASAPSPQVSPFDAATPAARIQPPEDDIPDFLREAGWGKSTGAFDESKSAFAESESAADVAPIEQGDLPDWVKAMAPQQQPETPQEEEELPDWINKIGTSDLPIPSETAEQADWMKGLETTPAAEEQPDWLKGFETTPASAEEQPDRMKGLEARPTSAEEQPDWMIGPEATPSSAEEQPDWLKQLAETQQPAASESLTEEPDWLKGFGSEPEAAPTGATAGDLDWLDQLSQGAQAPAAEPVSEEVDFLRQPSEPFDAAPSVPEAESADLFAETGAEAAAMSTASDDFDFLDPLGSQLKRTPASSTEEFDFLKELTPEPEKKAPQEPAMAAPLGTTEEEQDDAFAWLESLAAKQGATEGLLTRPEERLEEEPDWVKQAKGMDVSQPVLEEPATPSAQPEEPVAEAPGAEEPPLAEPSAALDRLGTSEQERDDSFAWLEALAAKQGASEGLLTKPEERPQEEPEWVRQARDLGEEMPAATAEPVSEPVAQEDEIETWLRSLDGETTPAAEPGATFEEKPVEAEPEAVQFEEAALEPPAVEAAGDDTRIWLRKLEEETPAQEPLEEQPAWLKQEEEVPAVEPPLAAPAMEQPVTPADAESWLESLEEEEAESVSSRDNTAIWLKSLDKLEKLTPEPLTPEPAQAMQPEELPAWMQDLEEQKTSEETGEAPPPTAQEPEVTEWMGAIEQAPEPVAQDAPRIDTGGLPSWLRGLEEEEAERVDLGSQEDLPAWLRDETSETVTEPAQIEPTRATDWQPVEMEASQPEPEAVELEPSAVAPIAEEPAPPPPQPEVMDVVSIIEEKIAAPEPEMEKPAPARPVREPAVRKVTAGLTDPTLGQARGELSRNNISGALDNYGRLIRKGRLLEDIIYDLREALYRYPVDVDIWQSLGDAYMRSNRLQDALDAYTKAEELLR